MLIGPALAMAAFRWLSGTPWIVDVLVCLTFLAAGTTIGGLVYDGFRARRERRQKEEAERAELRDEFRKVLARELCTRKKREFDFTRLVAEYAMPRFEADAAAAQVYRRFSDRVVEDGVITDEEQRRLQSLARLLEISPERVTVIEAAAKSDRFHAALEKVLADGVVTADEVRELEEIRASLGVSDEDWEKGRERIGANRFDSLMSPGATQRV
jgi:hypothetical protein